MVRRALLEQLPCMRMTDITGRKALYQDPNLRGVIYHTVKFCDYYGFEYSQLRHQLTAPLLKLESDYTAQSSEQLRTGWRRSRSASRRSRLRRNGGTA